MTLEELYERLDPIARDLIAANRNDPELNYPALIVSFFMYTLSASLEPPDPEPMREFACLVGHCMTTTKPTRVES